MASEIRFRTTHVDGLDIFYREAGDPSSPTLLLLHGFPTSSHMFRDLMPRLVERYHLVAPDLPGFGLSSRPDRGDFTYSFANLARTVDGFTRALGLDRYALYVFDYGAPIGYRLAITHPERITAIISQNGNAYEEGLSEGWAPLQQYWNDPAPANREALRGLLTAESIRWQYEHGVADLSRVSPDGSTLDTHFVQRPGVDEIQLDLFLDYASNVALYPAFQDYFRSRQPRLLAIWGQNDPFFLPAGALAYSRDIAKADVRLLDTGHFALETHGAEIAAAIVDFLG